MKKAFTLAEVLITLGIIGVVAAVTMPTLLNKAEKMILKNQFKKAYNLLLNVDTKIYADNNNSYYECYYSGSFSQGSGANSDCREYYKQMMNAFGKVKYCENQAFAGGCIPEYKGIDDMRLQNNPDSDLSDPQGCPNAYRRYILNSASAFVAKDGMIVVFYSLDYAPLFFVDINGKKSPNKWGHDLFSFENHYDGKKHQIKPSSRCMRPDVGGMTTDKMVTEVYK